MHEASQHKQNSFITLTYDENYLPADLSLHYPSFQLFMKRLRKHFTGTRIRFYACGEYGELNFRPHYHACLFGIDFTDKSFLKKVGENKLYRSPTLEKLWPFGYSTIGAVTFESAAYVARYIMKKITGDLAKAHYEYIDPDGVVHARKPEFTHMSLKPGIGKSWFDRYQKDVFPNDYVVINGKKTRPPKYYDRLLDKIDPDSMESIKYKRHVDGVKRFADNTDERLAVKERCAIAAISRFTKSI